eukprot:scaffold43613_cov61-Phaeocystis_antarctica.AAC.2
MDELAQLALEGGRASLRNAQRCRGRVRGEAVLGGVVGVGGLQVSDERRRLQFFFKRETCAQPDERRCEHVVVGPYTADAVGGAVNQQRARREGQRSLFELEGGGSHGSDTAEVHDVLHGVQHA